MQVNRLGRSSVYVTGLSFGAAGIGNLYSPVSDATARAAVRASWDAGIRCFDTAPHYGLGQSEKRLGAALRDYPREAYTVSTKVGRILEPVQRPDGDDSANGFAVPASHRRRWDFIDVVLLAGRYTLLDQSGLDDLLPAAEERGVSVVIGGVFNSGILADPHRGATFDYGAIPEDALTRALRMQVICEKHGINLRSAALQFPFGHSAVSSVLIGARSPDEVCDAVEQAERPIPPKLWRELHTTGLLPEDVPLPDPSSPRASPTPT